MSNRPMAKVNKRHVEQALRLLQDLLPGLDLELDWMEGRARLTRDGGAKVVSGRRRSVREMHDWLEAAIAGIDLQTILQIEQDHILLSRDDELPPPA